MTYSFIIHRERSPGRFGMSYYKVAAAGGEMKLIPFSAATAMVESGEAIWASELRKQKKASTAKTCQVCGRQIEASRGWIAHHGYTRPSHGWQTPSCYGAKYKPYEESWLALPGALEGCETFKSAQEEYLIELQEKPPVGFYVMETRRERIGYGCREEWMVQYSIWRGRGAEPLPAWKKKLQAEIIETERHIKSTEEQIEYFIGLIQKWKEAKQ